MARRYDFPDPRERSPKFPSVIIEPEQVLDLYNQEHPDSEYANVSETVRAWFISAALSRGWAAAEFHGQQCLLRANVQLTPNS